MAKDDKTAKRGIYLYIDGHEVTNNVTSINAELRRIQREQEKMVIGSREYVEASQKIKNLKTMLAEHRQQLALVNEEQKKGKDAIDKFNDGWQRFGNVITMSIAAITGFSLAMKKVMEQRNEFEQSQANIKALTGLDDDSIQWLSDQAMELSTKMTEGGLRIRQSAAEILKAFQLVGSAKPELLQDKEGLKEVTVEAMRLATAANMELNPAVNALTQAMNQYGATAEQAAKFTNVMAAGSKNGSADVENVAASILKSGVAANSAGVSIETLVGAIETLASVGIKGAVAGTGLRNVILRLEKQTDEGLKPSVVGMAQAMENLYAKGWSAAEMIKMFGVYNYNYANILMKNTDRLRKLTDAVTDTDIAVQQAAINSDTAQAKLAQVMNTINVTAIELGEKLNPALRVCTNSTIWIIKLMPQLLDFLKAHQTAIMSIVGGLAAYYIRVKAANAITAAWKLVSAAGTIATLALQGSFASANIAIAVYAQRLKTAIMQTRLFNGITKMNPWGLALSAITALAIAAKSYGDKMRDILDTEKQMAQFNNNTNAKIKEQSKKFNELNQKIHDNKLKLDERKAALEELKKMAPGYHATLTEEGKLINDNAEALERANFQMQKQIKYQEAQAKYLEIQKLVNDQIGKIEMLRNRGGSSDELGMNIKEEEKYLNELMGKREVWIKKLDSIRNERFSSSSKEKAKPIQQVDSEGDGEHLTEPEKESEIQKRIRKAIAAIDAEFDRKAADEKKKYLDGQYTTQAEYEQKLQDLELESLNRKLAVAGLEEKQRAAFAEKIQDIRIKVLEAIKKIELQEAVSDKQKLDENLAKYELQQNEELALLKNALDKQIIAEEDYLEKVVLVREKWNQKKLIVSQSYYDKVAEQEEDNLSRDIEIIKRKSMEALETEEERNASIIDAQKRFYERLLADENISEKKRTEIQRKYDEITLTEIEESYDTIIEKNRDMFDSMSSLGKDVGEELARFVTDTETQLGDFAKATVKIMLDTLEKILAGAIAERTIKNIASLGIAGVAKAAAEVALLTAAFETAKGAIGNFWTGGYTGSGAWNEPKGTVHAGEFVANRFAVENPQIRPVLDLINAAQRSGSVQNLTADDIAAVNDSPSKNPENSTDKALLAMMKEMNVTISRLKQRLDVPLEAYTTITGEKGSEKQNELYQRMIKNKSR